MSRRPGPPAGGPAGERRPASACPVIDEFPGGVLLRVRVQPGAARTKLQGLQGGELHLRVAAPPRRGEANEAARRYLAELLGVPASAVALVGGERARSKRFLVRGLAVADVRGRLAPLLEGGTA